MLSVSVCLFPETLIYDNENVDEEIYNANAWQQGEGDEGKEEGIWEKGKGGKKGAGFGLLHRIWMVSRILQNKYMLSGPQM